MDRSDSGSLINVAKSFKIRLFLLLVLWFGVRSTSIWKAARSKSESLESGGKEEEAEGLVEFAGVESMTVHDRLEAPGEVVPKSGYRKLCGWVVLLRSLWPAFLAVPRSCFRRSPRWKRSGTLTWCRLRRPTPRVTEAVLKR